MANSMPVLENFDPNGDTSSVGVRWEKWKRALNIYLLAANIKTPARKKATLLHLGGLTLQEIYHSIPEDEGEGEDLFDVAIEKLDKYFSPKQSKIYERHMFRLLQQEEGEKMEKFLVRLRNQIGKCQYEAPDEQIVDQIVEKCSSVELRKRILILGDKADLNTIINEANTLEMVGQQMKNFEVAHKTIEINKIDTEKMKNEAPRCFRCGSLRHLARDVSCPARGKRCNKCGILGHFRQFCKSKRRDSKDVDNANKRSKSSVDYVFQVDGNDALIKCRIGGISCKMLIDSGCNFNLLTTKTWDILKNNKVEVFNQIRKPNKSFLAYGSSKPLDVNGSFEAILEVGNNSMTSLFYVVNGGSKDLLGKESAIALGVLRLGLPVNQVAQNVFPKFKDILVEIPIDGTIKPVAQPYRRIPIPLEEKVTAELEKLLEADIIEEVKGPSKWVSPLVPILKEQGEIRLCVDMRRANQAVVRENHPLPTMDTLLPRVSVARYFSKLDIKNAFHQVEIHPESRHITTFITSRGLYRYKRLMFGITCAPEIFQKTLEKMLLGCKGVINFIDDILVYGKDETEHNHRLEKVITCLHDNNVLLNDSKCVLKVQRIQFLGHVLSASGVKPLNGYITNLRDCRSPSTVEELQSFLGLVNYVGKWIPNLATLTEPLRGLLRIKLNRNTQLEKHWGKTQNEAFRALKEAITNIKSLGYYNVHDETQVIADASPVGLGAVLTQSNGKESRVIAFGNRSLTDCERRYSQTEKEALALVWAVEHFNTFLFGKQFDLITDHKPLEVIFGPKSKPCVRIERWVLRLQAYNFRVKYQPGKTNIADPLSRLCKKTTDDSSEGDNHVLRIVSEARPVAVPLRTISLESEKDDDIIKVKRGLYENVWGDEVKGYKLFETELCFYGSILLRSNRIVIPKILRRRVLEAAHEGHPGMVAMKGRLRSKVWWPRIDQEVETVVKACKGCTLVSLPNPPNPIKRRELPDAPWLDVAVDLLGPLPNGEYLFVIVDYFSRYKEIKITKNITSTAIIKLLKEIFSRLGYPVSLSADNGKQFISTEFKDFCIERNIKLLNTIPYWPQQNGEIERQNRDILKRLKISALEKQDYNESLFDYLIMYNGSPHGTTGKSPSELFFNRLNRDKIPCIKTIINNSVAEEGTRDMDKEKKENGKIYADKKRKATDTKLCVGDKVYLKNIIKPNKLTPNFNPSAHTVQSLQGGDATVVNEETGQALRRNVVHLKRVEGEWKVQE